MNAWGGAPRTAAGTAPDADLPTHARQTGQTNHTAWRGP